MRVRPCLQAAFMEAADTMVGEVLRLFDRERPRLAPQRPPTPPERSRQSSVSAMSAARTLWVRAPIDT
jgi:hypothetical protein